MLTSAQKMIAVTRMPARSEHGTGIAGSCNSSVRRLVVRTFMLLHSHGNSCGLHGFGSGRGRGKEFAAADPTDFDELAGVGIGGGIIIETAGNWGALVHGKLTTLAVFEERPGLAGAFGAGELVAVEV